MKFGKQLHNVTEESDEQFVEKFMDYKGLKKIIKAAVEESKGQLDSALRAELGLEEGKERKFKGSRPALLETVQKMPPCAQLFFSKLEEEVEKVNTFFALQEKEIRVKLRDVLDKYKMLGTTPTREAVTRLRGEFLDLNRRLIQIEQFVFFNLTGFHKILKKFDKKTENNVRQQFVEDIGIQPFVASTIIPKLVKLSEAKFKELHELSKKFGAVTNGAGANGLSAGVSPQISPANKTPLQVVFSVARQLLQASDGMPDPQGVAGPVNKLTARDLGPMITSAERKAGIQYFDLYDDTEFSIGVFLIRKGEKIPLHEWTRGGCGVTKVLQGTLKLKCYAFVGGEPKRRKLSNADHTHDEALQAVVSLDTRHTPESMARVISPGSSHAIEYEALDNDCILFNVSTGPSAGDFEQWTFYNTTGTASGNLVDVVKLTPVRCPRGFSIHRESYVSWNRANSHIDRMPQ